MKKRFLVILLCMILSFALIGCNKNNATNSNFNIKFYHKIEVALLTIGVKITPSKKEAKQGEIIEVGLSVDSWYDLFEVFVIFYDKDGKEKRLHVDTGDKYIYEADKCSFIMPDSDVVIHSMVHSSSGEVWSTYGKWYNNK